MEDFRKRIIVENRGNIFLPGSLIRDGTQEDWEEWILESEGYLSLSHWMEVNHPSLPELLELLERILGKMILCQEYLLDPSSMGINRHTIWISSGNGKEVRLGYQPSESMERKEHLTLLIQEFMLLNRDPVAADYLQLISDRIHHENPGWSKLQRMILQMARELTICGWIKKNRAL